MQKKRKPYLACFFCYTNQKQFREIVIQSIISKDRHIKNEKGF